MDSYRATVGFDQLDLRSRAALTWGFLWRGALTTLASAVLGGLAGTVLGFVAGLMSAVLGYGGSLERVTLAVRVPSAVFGVAIGFAFFWLYVKWLFRARFAGYRLRLEREA